MALFVQFKEGCKGEPMARLWKKRGGEWQTDGRSRWTPAVIANNFKKNCNAKTGEVWEVEVETEIKDRDNKEEIRLVLLKPVRKCVAGVVEIRCDGDKFHLKQIAGDIHYWDVEVKKDEPIMPLKSWECHDNQLGGFKEWREFVNARLGYLRERVPELEREREEKLAFLAQPQEEFLFDVRTQENGLTIETCEGSWTIGAEDYKGTLAVVPRGADHSYDDFSDMGMALRALGSGFEVKSVGGVPVKELPKFLRWDKIVPVMEVKAKIQAYFAAEASSARWQEYEWPITHGAHSETNIKNLAQELEMLKGW